MSETSPTPWTSDGNGIHVGTRCVATTHMEPRERRVTDAALIVRAVNSYAEMVEALKEAELQIAYLHEKFAPTGSGETVLFKIRSALARASQTETGE